MQEWAARGAPRKWGKQARTGEVGKFLGASSSPSVQAQLASLARGPLACKEAQVLAIGWRPHLRGCELTKNSQKGSKGIFWD